MIEGILLGFIGAGVVVIYWKLKEIETAIENKR